MFPNSYRNIFRFDIQIYPHHNGQPIKPTDYFLRTEFVEPLSPESAESNL